MLYALNANKLIYFKVRGHKMTVAPLATQNSQTTTNQGLFSMEVRFAIVSIALCSCYMYLAVNWGIIWIYGGYFGTVHQVIQAFVVNILFNFMNPVLLLIFSTKFRQKFNEFVLCKHG